MTAALPTGELLAIAWITSVCGLNAGTTLPRNEAAWANSGFVQLTTVGGSPGIDTPIYNPVLNVDCWAVSPSSNKPPWGKANQLAEVITAAGFRKGAMALHISDSGYLGALVTDVYATTKPRRMLSDEARYARYQFDLSMHYLVEEITV